ncbi:MAG: VOC family protein, partial [Acidobacteriota bacterium]|nr:VOC family protein [Acidobacteriota bacterium]
MKLHHVGIAVESLKDAIPIFEKLLGSGPAATESVGEQGVRVAVFKAGEARIELLEA